MSLSAWEQQALNSIKDGLAGSDPKLVALLDTFSQQVASEQMPARERIRAGSCQPGRRLRRKWRHPGRDKMWRHARRVDQRLGLQRAAILISLMITITLVVAGLSLGGGSSQGGCTESWPAACADSAPAHGSGPAAHDAVAKPAPRVGPG
jgi:hypothetical protein